MKLVIDISDEAYKHLTEYQLLPSDFDYEWMLMHGTPLPKGHGRLIDGDELIRQDEWYNPVKYTDEYGDVITIADIVAMPTIIEADKEQT